MNRLKPAAISFVLLFAGLALFPYTVIGGGILLVLAVGSFHESLRGVIPGRGFAR